MVEQNFDFLFGGSIFAQIPRPRISRPFVEGIFTLQSVDVLQAQTDIGDFDVVYEAVPPGVALQSSQDAESGLIEVVKHQKRDLVGSAHLIDQVSCGSS